MILPAGDLATIAGIAAGCALGAGAVLWAVTEAARRRSLRAGLVVLALLSPVATVAAVVGTARAMFLSTHDLQVVVVVAVVVAVLGAVGSGLLARQLTAAGRRLAEAARAVGTGAAPPSADGPRLAAELAVVHAELVASAERLARARAQRERAEAASRDLVAAVSHDLRTPLAGLRAMAEALEDGVAVDPARYHARIRTTVDRLAVMADGLLDLTVARTTRPAAGAAPVVLADLVSDCLAGLGPLAGTRGLTLAGSAEEGLEVAGDGAGLARVLDNLVGNAIRLTDAGGVRVFSGRDPADPDRAVVTVADTGPGLDPGELDRIFEPGYRGTAAADPARSGGGAGLGLAITRAVVEAHGGSVTAADTGGGAVFTVSLPCRPPAPDPRPRTPPAPPPARRPVPSPSRRATGPTTP